jgi:hypothetical protein
MATAATDLYAALAAVAAITTALQGAVALPPLTDSVGIQRRIRDSQPGTAARHNAHADAAKSAVRGAILNFAAAAVNGAVLAAWSTVAWPGREPWTYYVPWLAVACASGLLLATAAYAVWKLNEQRS